MKDDDEYVRTQRMRRVHVLPNVMPRGIVTLFCGSAPGKESARLGAYYAHSGNRFCPTLHTAGFTDRCLRPAEYPLLPDFSIGITDLAKYEYGNDDELSRKAYDVEDLARRIRACAPRLIAFNGKRPASAFLGVGMSPMEKRAVFPVRGYLFYQQHQGGQCGFGMFRIGLSWGSCMRACAQISAIND